MLWAIDVGNSRTKFGHLDGGTFKVISIPTSELKPGISGEVSVSPGDELVACTVVPSAHETLETWAAVRGARLTWLNTGQQVGLEVRYDSPGSLGADRLANALALAAAGRLPAIAVDFGTATNFDVVDDFGVMLGGALMPGLETSLRSLAGSASQLPMGELRLPDRAIGTSTQECLRSGGVLGYCLAVDGLLAAIKQEVGGAPVLATGGLAELLRPGLRLVDRYDPHLTLRGLVEAHRRLASAG